MPIFEIEVDGKTYEADAPDAASAVAAIKNMSGGAKAATPSVPMDMAQSIAPGAVKGVGGLLGLPRGVMDILGGAGDAVAQAPGRLFNRFAGDGSWNMPESAVRGAAGMDERLSLDTRKVMPSKSDVVGAIEKNVTGPLYKPQTPEGRYVETATDFAVNAAAMPGTAGARLLNAFRYGVVPGLVSEFAGQKTEGTKYEPYARTAAALATTGTIAALSRPSYAERLVGRSAQEVSPQHFAEAGRLMRDAQARGITLTPAEAVQQVTGGASRLGDVQRIAESTLEGGNRMAPFYAQRPGAMARAVGGELDQIAPRSPTPGVVGVRAQATADDVVGSINTTINNATRADYTAAARQPIPAQTQVTLMADPMYAQTLQEIRNNPALNRRIANLPDESVGVVDRVQRRMAERATELRSPGQPGMSQTASTAFDEARTAPVAAAEAATGGRYGDYARARGQQAQMRENILDPVQAGPIGAIQATDDVATQGKALMGAKPSADEVAQASQMLSGTAPNVARSLVREELGRRADKTVDALTRRGVPDQFGGAKFVWETRGNPRVAANTAEAISATAGPQRNASFQRVLDALQATGWRQDVGSKTAFNTDVMRELERGGINAVGRAATKPASTISDAISRARLGSQSETLADLMVSGPEGLRRVQELAARGDDRARIVLQLLAADQAASR